MATNLADITEASNTNPGAGARKAQPSTARSEGAHKEALLDEALVETFPASDPISPAYEARLEAQRATAQDEDNARVRHIGTLVLGGLAGVAAVAVGAWLVRALVRHES